MDFVLTAQGQQFQNFLMLFWFFLLQRRISIFVEDRRRIAKCSAISFHHLMGTKWEQGLGGNNCVQDMEGCPTSK